MDKTDLLGLRHVRDDSIRDDEKDEVLRSVLALPCELGHVVDGGGEVGGAVQLDAGDARFVGGQNT